MFTQIAVRQWASEQAQRWKPLSFSFSLADAIRALPKEDWTEFLLFPNGMTEYLKVSLHPLGDQYDITVESFQAKDLAQNIVATLTPKI